MFDCGRNSMFRLGRLCSGASAILILTAGRIAVAVDAPVIRMHHSTTINGTKIEYDALFDTFPVSQPGHVRGATTSTISYVRSDGATGGHETRPVVFAF